MRAPVLSSVVASVAIALLLAVTATAASDAAALLGTWVGSDGERLVFESKDRLVFDGERYPYALQPGTVIVLEDGVPTPYPYTLKGSSLTIRFPDGTRHAFKKAGADGPPGGGNEAGGGKGNPSPKASAPPPAAAAPHAADASLARHFAGYWWAFSASSGMSSSGSGGSTLLLKPDGTFARTGHYATSGSLSGGGAYGHASQTGNRGRWSASGTKDQGVIRLVDGNGEVTGVPYRAKTPGRHGEYYFAGRLHVYATEKDLRYAGYGDAEIPR